MYDKMIAYVKEQIVNSGVNASQLKFAFPFRNRFEHTLRVYKWALRINEVEKGDDEVVRIAAIFHDVAKGSSGSKDHAKAGAQICKSYLEANGFDSEKVRRIEQAVANHSKYQKKPHELSLEDSIIIDADLMDEIGAITVLWDAMATGMEPVPSYNAVYHRLLKNYDDVCATGEYLKTETGKRFFNERLGVLRSFMEALKYELGI